MLEEDPERLMAERERIKQQKKAAYRAGLGQLAPYLPWMQDSGNQSWVNNHGGQPAASITRSLSITRAHTYVRTDSCTHAERERDPPHTHNSTHTLALHTHACFMHTHTHPCTNTSSQQSHF